jgi:uncharacterized protein (DUF433 family)
MDWSGCGLVEVVPGKVSGQPLVKGTRIPADFVVESFELTGSVDEVLEGFPRLSKETATALLAYAVERLAWDEKTVIDWRGCKLVEQVPGRCSGAPTVVGSRIFPDTIAKYYWSGATVEEIREDYPSLTEETIAGLIDYVKLQEAHAA